MPACDAVRMVSTANSEGIHLSGVKGNVYYEDGSFPPNFISGFMLKKYRVVYECCCDKSGFLLCNFTEYILNKYI